ncbi:MAG: glycosyltransferase [Lachnospiraceae bacterium]|nr:glycosyltransferase [Lachnospiraceae bacterium]MCI9059120.1 glycosyltransferase [Lachnospiraceae bacterium]
MNILFYRYNSICEPDIIAIMQRLGHTVTEITEEMRNKELDARGQMNLVSAELKKQESQIVFSINFFPVVSEVCNIFHIPYVCWIVDSPVMELYSHSIRNSWNRIFLFDYALYEEFRGENPKGIFYLPLGADYVRLDSLIETITEQDRKKYSADVSFIGSLYTEKCPYNHLKEESWLKGYLDGVIEAQTKVYGYNFLEECITDEVLQQFKEKVPFYHFPEKASHNDRAAMAHLYLGNKVTEQERLRLLKRVSEAYSLDLYTASDFSPLPRANYRGLAKSTTEMPKIFHLSKINLNFTSKPIRTGLPLRLWDILGAGGFALTNFQSEIPEYFEVGKDLDIYASEEELMEKIRYYLEHEKERQAIAESGYRKAKEQYSLELRVKQILKTVC